MKEIELESHFYDSNHRVCVEYLIKQPTIDHWVLLKADIYCCFMNEIETPVLPFNM